MSCTNATCLMPTTGVASQIFTSALQFFAASQCLLDDTTLLDYRFAGDSQEYEAFDFIIVGASSAGCVLANRLSEKNDWRIMLIEAGGDPPIESTIPRLSTSMYDSKYEWGFESISSGNMNQASKNGKILIPKGKMLGGTSNTDEMIYLRGNPANYKTWEDEGNVDWSPEQVNRYFRKAESLQDQSLLQDPTISKNYGHDGPLVINRFNSTYRELTESILAAYGQLGSPSVPDLNTANLLGSGIYTATAANGIRQSTNRDYLNPILAERKNLKIIKDTLVTKVLIDDYNNAYGVEAERDGKKIFFYAEREVILSAGAVNSPQLLMLSGIGPLEDLHEHGIPCKLDLPYVGKNLQSHNMVPVTIFGNGPPGMKDEDNKYQAIEYLYDRKGHLAESYLADILLFQTNEPKDTDPDFLSYLDIISTETDALGPSLVRLEDSVLESVKEAHKNHTLFLFYFNLQHAYSRGTIKLASANPKEYPIINLKAFEDRRDVSLAVKGIKKLTNILNTDYFKSIDGYLARLNWEPCDKYKLDSAYYWSCVCKNMVIVSYDLVGTCKMGPDPRTSVVDGRLRVHGVNNLRVVGESIMPTITTGSTDGPLVMIGERAADLIKEDYEGLERPEPNMSIEMYDELYPQVEEIVTGGDYFPFGDQPFIERSGSDKKTSSSSEEYDENYMGTRYII